MERAGFFGIDKSRDRHVVFLWMPHVCLSPCGTREEEDVLDGICWCG